jgi:epsilon-lactone hydrolase
MNQDLSPGITYRDIPVSLRSRALLRVMGMIAPRMLVLMAGSSPEAMEKAQRQVYKLRWPKIPGLKISVQKVGGIEGHTLGELNKPDQAVVLWLHGGAFALPAASMHFSAAGRLCKDLGVSGFMPDYRLAPQHPFPAGLDDCEKAYKGLLKMGYSPEKIVLVGDSAGGNLIFGLLQRIRRDNLGMPACAIPISPVTELGRASIPPSLYMLRRRDPLLPLSAMPNLATIYFNDREGSDPELSPLYMDCKGLPPLFFLASSHEILMDDAVHLAERCEEAGVETVCHVWPRLPHAFPIFERFFPEASMAIDEMVEFAQRHLPEGSLPD